MDKFVRSCLWEDALRRRLEGGGVAEEGLDLAHEPVQVLGARRLVAFVEEGLGDRAGGASQTRRHAPVGAHGIRGEGEGHRPGVYSVAVAGWESA